MTRRLLSTLALLLALALLGLIPGCPIISTPDDDDSGADDDDDTVADDDDTTVDDDDATGDDDDTVADDDDTVADDDDVAGPTVDDSGLDNPLAHSFGGSPCPTPMGSVTLSNPGTTPIDYSLSVGDTAENIRVFDLSSAPLTPGQSGDGAATGSVPAGGSVVVYVAFNCNSATASQSADLSVTLDGNLTVIGLTVNVSGGP